MDLSLSILHSMLETMIFFGPTNSYFIRNWFEKISLPFSPVYCIEQRNTTLLVILFVAFFSITEIRLSILGHLDDYITC